MAKSCNMRLTIIDRPPKGNGGILLTWSFLLFRSIDRRPQPTINRLLPVVLLLAMQGNGNTRAQSPQVQPSSAQVPPRDSTAPDQNSEQGTATPGAAGFATGRLARRDAALGLAGWDHTLLGAFELGERLLRKSAAADPLVANSVAFVRKPFSVFSTSGSRSSPWIHVSPIDQLSRNGMNVDMKSVFGNLNVVYREIFTGRPNTLGGGVGQASAAAMFTTPRFGSGGKFDFSAAALMGTGSLNTLTGGGFGNSLIGGNGPGRKSQTSPTVAIKLTF